MGDTVKKKKRPLTDAEIYEAEQLGYRGRRGQLTDQDQRRVEELYRTDPKGYGVAYKRGRKMADAEVNPW